MEKDEPHASIGGNQHEESADGSVRAPLLMPETGQEKPSTHGCAKPSNCRNKTVRFWDFKASHWITALLTAALVFVGVLQYCVYSSQAGIMDSQTRPWVGLNYVIIDPIKADERLSMTARIKNSGGTPALETTVCAGSDTPNASQIDAAGIKKLMKELDSCGQKAVFFLLPNTEVGMDVSRSPNLMTQQVVSDVLSDQATFAVFGRIFYKSPSNRRDHWTSFCALYVRASNSFSACAYGNETDDESASIHFIGVENNVITSKINKWAEPITIFTGLLVIVGALQVFVYFKQKSIMQASLGAQRRPRLLVRELLQFPITTGDTLKIQCAVGNAGDAEGTIVESYVDAQSSTFEEWRPRRSLNNSNPIGNVSVPPGGQAYWDIDCRIGAATLINIANAEEAARKQAQAFGPIAIGTIGPSPPTIHLQGFIVYIDGKGVRRRTAFLRHLDVRSLRFYTREDPDYEYAD